MNLNENELAFFRELDNLVKLVVDENGKEGDEDAVSHSILHSKTRKINGLIERLTAEVKGSWVRNFYVYSKIFKDGAPKFGKNYLFFRRLRRILFGSNTPSNGTTSATATTSTSSNENILTAVVSSSSLSQLKRSQSARGRSLTSLEMYMRTHESDPANLRIGTLVDVSKIHFHIHPNGNPTPGKVVIMRRRVGGFDWCLFARIVFVPNAAPGFVVATIDPLEQVCFEVPTKDLVFFNNEILNDDVEKEYYGVVGEGYGNLLELGVTDIIKTKLQEHLLGHVINYFHENGILRHGASTYGDGTDKDKEEDKFEQESAFEEKIIVGYIIGNSDDSGPNSSKGMYKCFHNIPKIESIVAYIDSMLRNRDATVFTAELGTYYTNEVIPTLRRSLPYVFPTYKDGVEITYACGPSDVSDSAVDVVSFVEKSLISTKDRCNKILSLLKMQYNEVLDDITKKAITEDYLSLIREEVNTYLTNEGFDHNAVPEDYVVTPPKDLDAVKKNAEICRNIIAAGDNSIDEWLTRVREVLSIELEIEPLLMKDEEAFMARADEEIKRRSAADPKNPWAKKMAGLVMDLTYCKQQRKLETAAKTDSLDIVPISGLVYSRLTRLENEALTVINIWGKS